MIKTVFLIILCVTTFIVSAQVDRCKCVENSLDKSTGQRIVQSKFYSVGKNEKSNGVLEVSVRRIDSLYYLYMISHLAECAGPTTLVTFTTVAGQVIKKKHIGNVDCGETFYLYGLNVETPNVIKTRIDEEMIRKGGLTRIRLSSSERYENIKLSMPFNLRTVFDCVDETFAKEAKRKPKKGLENTPPPE